MFSRHIAIKISAILIMMVLCCVSMEVAKSRDGERATFLHLLQTLKSKVKNTDFTQVSASETIKVESLKNSRTENEQEETENKVKKFRYEITLGLNKRLHLFWDIDEPQEIVTFQLRGEIHRNDFLGFGFSAYGEVNNADFFVMWTDVTGVHRFQDMHTDENGTLHIDQEQNYQLLGVDVSGDYVTVTFSRKYDTCDDDDYMIDRGTIHILFYAQSVVMREPSRMRLTSLDVGLQRAQLLKSQIPDPEMPSDTQTFTMHVDNVVIPTQETTYWCQIKKLPPLAEKHHVIKYEGVISPEAEGIVHHMEVFHCDVASDVTIREYNAECRVFGAERPEGLESCRQVIGAWAMGAVPLAYPEEAGYALGGGHFSRYIMMEVHYNNPNLKQGVVDSSGIKFYVTKELRAHDAGIMELGLEYTDKYAIPPLQPLFDLTGYCIPQCTQVGLPRKGIHVFASQLHTHLTGKRVITRHYRAGVELPELNRDNHYSPHYQEIRKLRRPVTVLPGDALVTTCQDGTKNKSQITMGGFAITDEMCVNYVHYYPKARLEVCKSSVTTKSLYGFFKFLRLYQRARTSGERGISENYKSIDWSPMNVELLRTFYETAPLSMQCNRSDGVRFPGVNWEGQRIPQVLFPMPPAERPCLT